MGKTSRERPRRTTPPNGPIFQPPPMWAPTPAERLGSYPAGWQLKTRADFKSPAGCLAIVGAISLIGALVVSIISHIMALSH